MAYYNYSNYQVFENSNINSICNFITQALIDEFGAGTVNDSFGLTGSACKIFQDAMPKEPVKVVAFVTDDEAIFNFLRANLNSIMQVQNAFVLTDVIQIENPNAFFEFWLRSENVDFVQYNTIFMEQVDSIPYYIN